MYKFLKVEGIDNVNTPLFETLQEQKAWFTSKVQVIIDDIFPPYYTNVISVSSDELDYPYASWQELNKDGTSNFITDKEEIITRYVDKSSFYNQEQKH